MPLARRTAAVACTLGVLLLGFAGIALSQEKPVVVNLMIGADINQSPTHEQLLMADSALRNLTYPVDSRGLNATIYVSGDMASENRLGIMSQCKPNHELALRGNSVDEKLSSLSYDGQESSLTRANGSLSISYVCGQTHPEIRGFMPQAFDQNNDTFKVLEKLGTVYDAGFQAGLIYRSGHENDTWPYPIEGYNLTAVPVSSLSISGARLFLDDRYIKEEKKFSGSQWYDLLTKRFDESAKTGNPTVVVFSNLVSGTTSDYLDAYTKFLDYAKSKGAVFVTTMQLVEMAASPHGQAPSAALKEVMQPANSSKVASCPTCAAKAKSSAKPTINVSVKKNQGCQTCSQHRANLINKTNSTKKT